jgi:membrane protein YqaA with SNARE-associated domain
MNRIGAWALTLGGPGLFVVAFLDSSFLSLPQINDLLVIWMVTKHPGRMLFYALMATLGSVAGCLVMHYLGRRGGEALLERRFRGGQLARARALFERYGFLAVIVPALLPPPAPFKVFVILAGVAGMPLLPFTLAVGIGRGVRYLAEGLLAVWFGERALDYVRDHARGVSLALALTVAAGGLLYYFWRLRRGNAT